jgi:hypothetical protein
MRRHNPDMSFLCCSHSSTALNAKSTRNRPRPVTFGQLPAQLVTFVSQRDRLEVEVERSSGFLFFIWGHRMA